MNDQPNHPVNEYDAAGTAIDMRHGDRVPPGSTAQAGIEW
jgi:hypothetical protein